MGKIDYWEKFQEGAYYHIYNRSINSTPLFTKEENYYFFLQKWRKLIHPFFETISYCLMSNHFHFLVSVKPSSAVEECIRQQKTKKNMMYLVGEISYNTFLEDQFKRLFSSYALAFNKQEKRTGSLFQKRFKRVVLKNEFKLWHLIAYI